jgi:hypothetical protein
MNLFWATLIATVVAALTRGAVPDLPSTETRSFSEQTAWSKYLDQRTAPGRAGGPHNHPYQRGAGSLEPVPCRARSSAAGQRRHRRSRRPPVREATGAASR